MARRFLAVSRLAAGDLRRADLTAAESTEHENWKFAERNQPCCAAAKPFTKSFRPGLLSGAMLRKATFRKPSCWIREATSAWQIRMACAVPSAFHLPPSL